jgi:hypothetical protein
MFQHLLWTQADSISESFRSYPAARIKKYSTHIGSKFEID